MEQTINKIQKERHAAEKPFEKEKLSQNKPTVE
jgi:hypothetical protein